MQFLNRIKGYQGQTVRGSSAAGFPGKVNMAASNRTLKTEKVQTRATAPKTPKSLEE
jgi:adenosylmethionine-8-amino-7-oxononanoate aminotransferase